MSGSMEIAIIKEAINNIDDTIRKIEEEINNIVKRIKHIEKTQDEKIIKRKRGGKK